MRVCDCSLRGTARRSAMAAMAATVTAVTPPLQVSVQGSVSPRRAVRVGVVVSIARRCQDTARVRCGHRRTGALGPAVFVPDLLDLM